MRQQLEARLPGLSEATLRFVDGLSAITGLEDLSEAMAAITEELGFGCYVLGQLPSTDYEGAIFLITNYPPEWRDAVYSRLLFGEDPVIDTLADAVAPFLWEETPGYLNPTEKQKKYLDLAFTFGLSRGYAVPIKVPGEPPGVVSFATRNNAEVPRDVLPFTSYVATSAYRRANSLVVSTRSKRSEQVALTKAEITVLLRIAQGKSNFAISQLLDLSSDACNRIIKSISNKLGYSNRTLMAVRALQLGIISYHDVLLG